ncbi:hypothetical protein HUG12_09765 [Halorarum salinum]|uniref:Uncharacterized protein n=2 Tax=Halorarum salinum TaxID=2743089 RepID=A0A7D5LAD8_9EURY|nr:hypothetical protein HUG12_09765 [Halobaculum salinum]
MNNEVAPVVGDTYTLNPPKTCRFCGEAMPTKTTNYENDRVDLDKTLVHFRKNPACQRRLIQGETE